MSIGIPRNGAKSQKLFLIKDILMDIISINIASKDQKLWHSERCKTTGTTKTPIAAFAWPKKKMLLETYLWFYCEEILFHFKVLSNTCSSIMFFVTQAHVQWFQLPVTTSCTVTSLFKNTEIFYTFFFFIFHINLNHFIVLFYATIYHL